MTQLIKARPTLYKGIQMRSRLEADYAAMLDHDGETWEYEPICFAADGDQWLPDFRITRRAPGYDNPFIQYVEVKPASLLQWQDGEQGTDRNDRVDALLKRMSVAWESEPYALLQLSFWTYGRHWPDFMIMGRPAAPWMAYCGGEPVMPLVWPGMGQQAALPFAPESNRRHQEAS